MMTTKLIPSLSVLFLSLTLSAQTFLNASFEDWPDSCAVDLAPTGWNNFSPIAGPDQRGTNCEGSIIPFEGDSYLGLRWSSGAGYVNDGASQVVSDLIVGQTYTVSFFAIADDYSFYHEPINVMVYLDSTLIYYTPALIEDAPWTPFSVNFTASDTIAEIAFQAAEFDQGSSSFSSLGIDAVSISTTNDLDKHFGSKFFGYPNPTRDILNVSGIHQDDESYVIFNLQGNAILLSSLQKNSIDISSLQAGIYFIQIGDNPLNRAKFIKE